MPDAAPAYGHRVIRAMPDFGVEKSAPGPWTAFQGTLSKGIREFFSQIQTRLTVAQSAVLRDDFREVGRLVLDALVDDRAATVQVERILERAIATTSKRYGIKVAPDPDWLAAKAANWADLTVQSTVNGLREAAGFARTWKLSDRETADWMRDTAGLTRTQVRQMARAYRDGKGVAKAGSAFRKGRADLIAEHQSQWSYQQGQRAVYGEIEMRGGEVTRTWQTAANPCDKICRPMQGQRISAVDLWRLPDGRWVETPVEAHPHCRCNEVYSVKGVWKRDEGGVVALAPGALTYVEKYDPSQARWPAGSPGSMGGKFRGLMGPKGRVAARSLPLLDVVGFSTKESFTGKPQPCPEIRRADMGWLGERLLATYLEKVMGVRAGKMPHPDGVDKAAPCDIAWDHRLIECKAGHAKNVPKSQRWRNGVGMDKKYLKNLPREKRLAAEKRLNKESMRRKFVELKKLSEKLGINVEPETYGFIVNTKTNTADIYRFKGFHAKPIGWKPKNRKTGYVGTLKFSGWDAHTDAVVVKE